MRAQEFLSKIGFGTGSQTEGPISVTDIEPEEIINPGQRSDDRGNYKWSPPLQQQLDAVKDLIGTSNDELNTADAEAQDELSAVKRTINIIGALTNTAR